LNVYIGEAKKSVQIINFQGDTALIWTVTVQSTSHECALSFSHGESKGVRESNTKVTDQNQATAHKAQLAIKLRL